MFYMIKLIMDFRVCICELIVINRLSNGLFISLMKLWFGGKEDG